MKKLLVLLYCLGLATTASAELIALYEFEGTGGTEYSDTSGSTTTYDGTPVGTVEVIADPTGARGGTVLHTSLGAGDYTTGNNVDCGVVTDSSVTDLTVGLWVMAMAEEPVGASRCPLTHSSDCYQTAGGWQLMMREGPWPGPNNFWAGINGAPDENPAWDGGYLFIHKDPDPVFTYGEWVHVAYTFDATSRMMKGYVNGLPCGEKLVTEATRCVGGVDHLILGGQFEQFTGYMDDVFVGTHAMDLAEIQDISGIPEPATILLLGMGGLALLRKRR